LPYVGIYYGLSIKKATSISEAAFLIFYVEVLKVTFERGPDIYQYLESYF